MLKKTAKSNFTMEANQQDSNAYTSSRLSGINTEIEREYQ